jgi:uncharacterized phage-associated protein
MSDILFKNDPEKMREVILYVAKRVKEPTLHTVSKIMYFADRLHLADYGRFITGDMYIAMEYGPVPSAAYDYLKELRRGTTKTDEMSVVGYNVVPQRDANREVLSESDIDCLNRSIQKYGRMTFGELTDASHDQAWHASPANGEITIETIIQTFEDADALLEHLRNQHP